MARRSDNGLRFVIDKDPNVVLFTDSYPADERPRIEALAMTAYHSQSPIRFIRSDEATSAPTHHYARTLLFNEGSYVFD